jgi:hypothetical protein
MTALDHALPFLMRSLVPNLVDNVSLDAQVGVFGKPGSNGPSNIEAC